MAGKASEKKRKSSNEMDDDTQDEHYFNDVDFELIAPSLPPFPDEKICQAVSFDSKANFFEVKMVIKCYQNFIVEFANLKEDIISKKEQYFAAIMVFLCVKRSRVIQKIKKYLR